MTFSVKGIDMPLLMKYPCIILALIWSISYASFVSGADYVNLTNQEESLLLEIPKSARNEYPDLFKDRTLDVMELNAKIDGMTKEMSEVFKLYCDTYHLVNELVKKGNLESGASLSESISNNLASLIARCQKHGYWK